MAITSLKLNATRARLNKSDWRGERSNVKQKTKVANSFAKNWQTNKMTLK